MVVSSETPVVQQAPTAPTVPTVTNSDPSLPSSPSPDPVKDKQSSSLESLPPNKAADKEVSLPSPPSHTSNTDNNNNKDKSQAAVSPSSSASSASSSSSTTVTKPEEANGGEVVVTTTTSKDGKVSTTTRTTKHSKEEITKGDNFIRYSYTYSSTPNQASSNSLTSLSASTSTSASASVPSTSTSSSSSSSSSSPSSSCASSAPSLAPEMLPSIDSVFRSFDELFDWSPWHRRLRHSLGNQFTPNNQEEQMKTSSSTSTPMDDMKRSMPVTEKASSPTSSTPTADKETKVDKEETAVAKETKEEKKESGNKVGVIEKVKAKVKDVVKKLVHKKEPSSSSMSLIDWSPSVSYDMKEGKEGIVTCDFGEGMEVKNVNVEVNDEEGMITIKGKKMDENSERWFEQSIVLPDWLSTDITKYQTHFDSKSGRLTLTIPTTPSPPPRPSPSRSLMVNNVPRSLVLPTLHPSMMEEMMFDPMEDYFDSGWPFTYGRAAPLYHHRYAPSRHFGHPLFSSWW
jgi:hypothetical protein